MPAGRNTLIHPFCIIIKVVRRAQGPNPASPAHGFYIDFEGFVGAWKGLAISFIVLIATAMSRCLVALAHIVWDTSMRAGTVQRYFLAQQVDGLNAGR